MSIWWLGKRKADGSRSFTSVSVPFSLLLWFLGIAIAMLLVLVSRCG